jgi:hypothetical protein
MGILSDLLGGVALDLYDEIPTQIKAIYDPTVEGYKALPEISAPDITFQPFTVTGPTGTIAGGPTGTSYSLGGTGQQLQSALESAALSRFGATPVGAGQLGTAGQQLLGVGQQQLGVSPFGLAGQQQAAQQAFGLGGQFMGQAGMPMGAREQEVYDRIRATQLGEEERQRLALEERLFAQGRGGVRTAMFGGTPEQLAMAQAQEQAQNQAALMAITQAQQEQRQAADIGATYGQLGSNIATQRQALEAAQQAMAMGALQGGMGLMAGGLGLEEAQQGLGLSALQGAYIPQAAMLSAFSPALNVASMTDVARRQMGQYGLEAQLANLEADVGRRLGLAELYGGMFTGAGSLVGGLSKTAGDLIGDLIGGKKPWWLPSDVSLKTNIEPVGKLPNGINLYTWDWNEEGKRIAGDAPTYGVIAQEVQEVAPEAVTRGDHGYLMVNYSKLI